MPDSLRGLRAQLPHLTGGSQRSPPLAIPGRLRLTSTAPQGKGHAVPATYNHKRVEVARQKLQAYTSTLLGKLRGLSSQICQRHGLRVLQKSPQRTELVCKPQHRGVSYAHNGVYFLSILPSALLTMLPTALSCHLFSFSRY